MIGSEFVSSVVIPAVVSARPFWKPSCNTIVPNEYARIMAGMNRRRPPPVTTAFVTTSPAAKPVIQLRFRSSNASDRRGLRTESGGRAEAASCSRIQAQLIARADTNVSRIANVSECTTSLRVHRYTEEHEGTEFSLSRIPL